MKTIDVSKCEILAGELLTLISQDKRFELLPNYELEAILAFAISLNSFMGTKTADSKIAEN